MIFSERFAPFEALAKDLIPNAIGDASDASHDVAHLHRVWQNVQKIAEGEGGDLTVLAAAAMLHDCVDVGKDSPDRARASRMAAEKARRLLMDLGWDADKIDKAAHAIEAHSFSARIAPQTIEAKILKDADRLDAIGHIGIARCFYVSGRLGRSLYDHTDPDACGRDLDDLSFAIDHFKTKLLTLSGGFQTQTAQALAYARHKAVEDFLAGFLAEVA